MISQDNKQAMRNPWVLGWLGILITVIGVNIAFIITAFSTSPGLVDEGYYEKGRDHEKNFQQKMETRHRLGWNISLQTPETITLGVPANFSVSVTDRNGNPLKGATATLHAYRPSDAAADFTAELTKVDQSEGVFQSKLPLTLKGVWDLNITVVQGEELLETSRRVTVVAQ
jgi:nitrogen fixation protein FixH